jgi:exodeoxyribonuclease VII small subunit
MPKPVKNPESYRQMSEQLQAILDWFETAEPDLEEALSKYEQATKLIADMEKYLKTSEIKIKKISAGLK